MKELLENLNYRQNLNEFQLGNLKIEVKFDNVLAAVAMPELENPEVITPWMTKSLWRAWVVAAGLGTKIGYKYYRLESVDRGDFIYFRPQLGHFFNFNNIQMVFVKYTDIELTN